MMSSYLKETGTAVSYLLQCTKSQNPLYQLTQLIKVKTDEQQYRKQLQANSTAVHNTSVIKKDWNVKVRKLVSIAVTGADTIEEALRHVLIENTTVPKFLFILLCEHFGWLPALQPIPCAWSYSTRNLGDFWALWTPCPSLIWSGSLSVSKYAAGLPSNSAAESWVYMTHHQACVLLC